MLVIVVFFVCIPEFLFISLARFVHGMMHLVLYILVVVWHQSGNSSIDLSGFLCLVESQMIQEWSTRHIITNYETYCLFHWPKISYCATTGDAAEMSLIGTMLFVSS